MNIYEGLYDDADGCWLCSEYKAWYDKERQYLSGMADAASW
ncbi:MAG: hypothetical protein ACE1Y4_18995 [Lysobacterales bacterium]